MITREYFGELANHTLGLLTPGEHLSLNLAGEQSQFIRISGAKIRQIGTVDDASLELTFLLESAPGGLQKASRAVVLSGAMREDKIRLKDAISALRAEARTLPQDPYAQLPGNLGSSESTKKGSLLSAEEAPDALLRSVPSLDLVGIYASGPVIRAVANSAGQSHWFSTETFSFDYSVYTPSRRALHSTFAGSHWEAEKFHAEMEIARERAGILDQAPKRLERGAYRTYLAPAAFHDIVRMLSWGAIGEASLRQGDSPLRVLRSGEKSLSPRFSLYEDFRGGEAPRFNDEGELAPELLPLISEGRFLSSLVGQRSAKEYGLPSNGGNRDESLRAPSVSPGGLRESEVLGALGEGLYLSNLHYLNWSDQPGGRITGMTRYACFWVENGKIVAPIENMRFDDAIFRLLGSEVIDFTRERIYDPETGTYYRRAVGGGWMPGCLLSGMEFTL